METTLWAEGLELRYDERVVARDLDLCVPQGRMSVIVGPNACGKSTSLRALARLLSPTAGRVLLEDRDIRELGAKELAKRLGLLPQTATAPSGIAVGDLVARGRFPHQRFLQQWSKEDAEAVRRALTAAGVADLSDRPVDELSGGQRQRVWLALLLAQDTPVMLLDEPTTFLDIAHQLEVLELCRRLNRDEGRTLVLVLHDLNQAVRYADHLIAMRDGAVVAAGAPQQVVTPRLLREVFDLEAEILTDPVTGGPLIVPVASVRS